MSSRLVCLFMSITLAASAETVTLLPVIVVTADRAATPWVNTAAAAESLSAEILEQNATRTLPEALNETVGVSVQKTSYGQGSPYLRGFTGFRTLLLVDGIRLNHPAFRDGANQYWNTVDSLSLNSIEIVRGAGSVLYGSDAVGGTVQALTRTPEFAAAGQTLTTGRLFSRVSTAERSFTGRAEGTVSQDRWALLAGVTSRTFGDLDGGKETGRQRKTGYDELNYDFKLRLRLSEDRELTFAYQNVAQDDIWRTHRTPYGISYHGTSIGNEQRHLFDQNRQLAYARYLDTTATPLYDQLTATVYWQNQSEDKDVLKKDGAHTTDGFDIDTVGALSELQKDTGFGLLVSGLEWVHDAVDTYRTTYSAESTPTQAIQGPVGDDATVDTVAAFVEHRTPLGTRWTATPGVRLTWVEADVGRYEDFTQTPHAPASLTRDWTDLCGSLTLARQMLADDSWSIYGTLAQSFRAPNLSDLTRFDDARSGDVEIPSPDVDSEHFVTGEIGSRVDTGILQWHVAYFYTWIEGLILRKSTGVGTEYTKNNGGNGYVHGIETSVAYDLGGGWSTRNGLTWMEGYSDDNAGLTEPVRTMPLTFFSALRYTSPGGRLWIEPGIKCADKEDRLTAADRRDTQRIPPGGTPGYAICTLRAGWRATDALTLGASLENILDTDYRIHGSGSNEPGRNLIMTASCAF